MRQQELAPAEPSPRPRRRNTGLPQDRANGGRRHRHAHTGELTNDPLIAPARILTSDSHHELVDVLGDSGPAGTASGVRPPSPNKPAMPAQYGVRANEQRLPGSTTQKAARRSEEETVGVLQPRTGDLTAKNRELVSQHHDLELLELTRTQTQCGHRERTPKQQIHHRHEQEQTPSTRTRTKADSMAATSAA